MDATIDAVRVAGTPDGPVPVVLLAPGAGDGDDVGGDADGDDPRQGGGAANDSVLPIFIGFDEAVSIARGLDAEGIGRPLTHDLLLDTIEELGGRVQRVVIADLVEGTYVADLHLATAMGSDATVDARPSDSLALAARTNAPIEIDEAVFEEGRTDREEFDELDDIRDVVEFESGPEVP